MIMVSHGMDVCSRVDYSTVDEQEGRLWKWNNDLVKTDRNSEDM